jgi:DNA-binding XRE family transcriptional regulator
MKTYRVIGSQVKRRRELLTSEATQKEFAFAVGISERTLRNIENNNASSSGMSWIGLRDA